MSLLQTSLRGSRLSMLKMGAVGLLSVGLLACSNSSEPQDMSMPSSPSADAAQPNTGAAGAASASAGNVNAANAASPENLTAPPRVEVAQETFAPSAPEVQSAFANVLVDAVSKMQASEQRDQWYQQQVNILQTLEVQSCTATPPGTPAVCRIVINNQTSDIKILLTQSGWMLVK